MQQKRCQSQPLAIQSLESRRLLAAIFWDGGGDNLNWDNPLNWSGDIVPTSADDATIPAGAGPNIALTDIRAVRSLVTNRNMAVSGMLTVATTATLNAQLLLAGGTLNGGAYTVVGANLQAHPDGGRLKNVAITGDIFLAAANSRLIIEGTTSFGIAHLSGSNTSIGFVPGTMLHGNIQFEGGRGVEMDGSGGTLTIAPGSSITGAGGSIGPRVWFGGDMSLVNHGTISAEAAGSLSVAPASFTNAADGLTQAIGGGGLALGTDGAMNWTNAGIIRAVGGTVIMRGTFNATAGAGTFDTGSGTVQVQGTINNAGNTLTLNDSTGSWQMYGGTITGGNIQFANNKFLDITRILGSRLNDVAIAGDLNFTDSKSKVIIAGTTSFAVAHLNFNDNAIGFAPGAILKGTIQLEGAQTGPRHIEMDGGTGTLTIAPGASIKTTSTFQGLALVGLGFVFGGSMSLINNGTISSETVGGSIEMRAASFTNSGTLQALNGGVLGFTLSNWNNSGTINLNASTLNLGGTFNATGGIGTFSNIGSQVNITGTINNTGNTLTLSNATGNWNLAGGTVSGGTLNYTNGRQLIPTNSGGMLDNLTINGDLVFAASSARAIISGTTSFATARLRGTNSSIGFAPGTALNGNISFEGLAIGNRHVEMNGTSGGLIIAQGSAITTGADFGGVGNIGQGFWFGGNMTLTNNGLISSQTSGRTIIVAAASFENNNLVEATNNGTMNLRSANSGGILTGGNWKIYNSGTLSIQPGSAGADAALRDAVHALVKSGRSGGTWDGPGIGSTALPPNQALGVILDTGATPDAVVVRHTLMGDLNLDRVVTISDFLDLASNFGKAPAFWWEGDVNYDGTVSIADFLDLASNFNKTLTPPSPAAFAPASIAAVDEPVESYHVATTPLRRHRPHHRSRFILRRS